MCYSLGFLRSIISPIGLFITVHRVCLAADPTHSYVLLWINLKEKDNL